MTPRDAERQAYLSHRIREFAAQMPDDFQLTRGQRTVLEHHQASLTEAARRLPESAQLIVLLAVIDLTAREDLGLSLEVPA